MTFRVWTTALSVGLCTMVLTACGGGSSVDTANQSKAVGSSSTTVTSGTSSVRLSLSLPTATVTSAAPVTATVTVTDARGVAVPRQIVEFSTVRGLGALSSVTALTQADGTAQVILTPAAGKTSGADELVATASISGATASTKQGFQLGDSSVGVTFSSGIPAGSTLSAYGEANLGVTLSNVTAGSPVSLSISSICSRLQKASFSPATTTTTSGRATFIYRDIGCGSLNTQDVIDVSVAGSTATATTIVPLALPANGSINFVSATPKVIYVKGSGYTENSVVVLKVLDSRGNPLAGKAVSLELLTQAGGLLMDDQTAALVRNSDADGNVQVSIKSGSVPTPVRVRATLVGTAISTVSSELSVAVGLPVQNAFSMSLGKLNIEAMNRDLTENTVSVVASDRMGNPVPEGTSINFVTSGGQVEAVRQITSDAGLFVANAKFVSSSPRPPNGRVNVLAYALGDESFVDANGNNIYDLGETFQELSGSFYLDRNSSGAYDSATDQLISSASPAVGTGTVACVPQANYQVAVGADVPMIDGTCDGVWGRGYVRRTAEMVFSTSAARPVFATAAGLDNSCSALTIVNSNSGATGTYYLVGQGVLGGRGASGSFNILVADANNIRLNPMSVDTVVSASTPTNGLSVSVSGGSTVGNSLNPTVATISYTFDPAVVTLPTTGIIVITITSPSGVSTTVTQPINTAVNATACPL